MRRQTLTQLGLTVAKGQSAPRGLESPARLYRVAPQLCEAFVKGQANQSGLAPSPNKHKDDAFCKVVLRLTSEEADNLSDRPAYKPKARLGLENLARFCLLLRNSAKPL
jgi:hypothetical protein